MRPDTYRSAWSSSGQSHCSFAVAAAGLHCTRRASTRHIRRSAADLRAADTDLLVVAAEAGAEQACCNSTTRRPRPVSPVAHRASPLPAPALRVCDRRIVSVDHVRSGRLSPWRAVKVKGRWVVGVLTLGAHPGCILDYTQTWRLIRCYRAARVRSRNVLPWRLRAEYLVRDGVAVRFVSILPRAEGDSYDARGAKQNRKVAPAARIGSDWARKYVDARGRRGRESL